MLTREIDFFGKTLKVNVSSIIPLKYNFEFKKDGYAIFRIDKYF